VPSGWLADTALLYGRVFRRGAEIAVRSWPLGVAVVAYGVVIGVAGALVAPLGLVGGVLLWLLTVACMSSWLSLTAHAIRFGRVHPRDLLSGFGAYLSDLLTVFFLVWILRMVAAIVLAPVQPLQIVFVLATVVFFNAVPELIYLGRHGPMELLVASYRFIGENWIEWFPANLALGLLLAGVVLSPVGDLWLVQLGASAVVVAYGMIVRGLLFQELMTGGRRARAFRRLAG
jgi:hypothetical protein